MGRSARLYAERLANTSGCTPYGESSSCINISERAYGAVAGSPADPGAGAGLPASDLGIARGEGCHLVGRDGKRYIDFSNAFGSVMLGHGDPDVIAAAVDAVRAGVPAAADKTIAAELSERFAADLGREVRTAFFKTGTTAVRAAVTAVQLATGRSLIASSGFHGWDVMWMPAERPFSLSEHGVFDALFCADELAGFLETHGDEVAALVVSPDYLHYSPASLAELFEVARRRGVMLVADEVKYGYRFAPGPSIGRHGIHADVYVFAKALANGWPLACVTGSPEVLARMSQFGSTLAYEVVSLSAARATLAKIDAVDARESVRREAGRFLTGVRALIADRGLPIDLVGDGQCFQFVTGTRELEEALVLESRRAGLIFQLGDSQLPSWAFSGAAVDTAVDTMERVLGTLGDLFPHLVGRPVSDLARMEAAWLEMDGLTDLAVPEEVKKDFLAAIFAPPPEHGRGSQDEVEIVDH